jgi:chemotaxis family two-component system response regulator Rcp1
VPNGESGRPVEVLLVEDNPGDARLVIEAFRGSEVLHNLHTVVDGEGAMAFLHREGKYADAPLPDIILLDLNLPKKDGREVLAEIKGDPDLRRIPVVIMTISDSEEDILNTYHHYANSYITKPVDPENFMNMFRSIEDFWLRVVRLPSR